MFPDLRIIIVNHDLKTDTAECIDSLLQAGAALQQISVVDNCSSDGSVAFLEERFGPGLAVLALQENFGYAYGLNQGLKAALQSGAEWFLLMNNDTLVAPDFLAELEQAARRHPQYACFGPLILYHSQPDTVWFIGSRRMLGTLFTRNIYRGRKASQIDWPEVLPVDFLHGTTLMVQRQVIERVGLFNDISLIYGEEVDFEWRAHLAGFRFAGAPRARMWHKISAFMNRVKPKTRFLKLRNQAWFYRRYTRGPQAALTFLLSLARCIGLTTRDLFTGGAEVIPATWQGFFTGWFTPEKPDFSAGDQGPAAG
jgi:GT2 family glycosyltransferase